MPLQRKSKNCKKRSAPTTHLRVEALGCAGCSKENCVKTPDFLVIFVSLLIPQGIVYHQHEVLHIIKTLVLYIVIAKAFWIHAKAWWYTVLTDWWDTARFASWWYTIALAMDKNTSFRRTRCFGALKKIRTPDLLVRSQTLYPAELSAQMRSFSQTAIV